MAGSSVVLHHYQIYETILRSNVVLEELPATPSRDARFSFELREPGPLRVVSSWAQEVAARGTSSRQSMQMARWSDGYLIRFPELVDFELSLDGDCIAAVPSPALTSATLRHLLIDQVLPRALGHRGQWVVHASAIATPDGRGVLFTAPSGSGKSTLASALVNAGCSLLNDDGILLRPSGEEIECIPGYAGVRLWNDSAARLYGPESATSKMAQYSEKNRIDLRAADVRVAARPVPLRRFYILDPRLDSRSISMSPLSPREACLELVKSTFMLDFEDPARLRSHFELCAKLAARPVFFRLSYPRNWDDLPLVQEKVLEHAAAGGD